MPVPAFQFVVKAGQEFQVTKIVAGSLEVKDAIFL